LERDTFQSGILE
jgi:hypothetical protein